MRKLTCSPNAETIGILLNAFADNLQGAETAPIMEKHGLMNLDPHGWHAVKNLLDALNDLAAKGNVSANMTAIGVGIGQTVPIPPELPNPTLEQVLNIWNDLYQGLHRNADVGSIQIEKVSDKHFKTIHSVIYPDDMSYGVLYAYGRRFLPPGTYFKAYYDLEVPARDYGGTGDVTIIHIEWE